MKNQNMDTWNSQPFEPRESQVINFHKKRKSVSTDDSIENIPLEKYAPIVVINT